jgi:hypothetical protein
LLLVGGNDVPVIGMNQAALAQLGAGDKQLVIIPGATHLFEEPGTLEQVARLAAAWFSRHLESATRERKGRMELTSTAFQRDGTIPEQYTGDGRNVSPPLKWGDFFSKKER